ncbi:MAG: cupin domain-containing protein [Pseudomonadota bacterium]|nr:cupin domain-containing protein [Burkholderiaceae bacterium]MDQ3445256.1 cupin domain-containing protein [Pseudomonadota bacterium]
MSLPPRITSALHFPPEILALPKFGGPFDAFKLEAGVCDVLFASYPAGTLIPPHQHDTANVGVITHGELLLTVDGAEKRYGPGDWYHVPARAEHSARFEHETSEIEFWFHSGSRAAI